MQRLYSEAASNPGWSHQSQYIREVLLESWLSVVVFRVGGEHALHCQKSQVPKHLDWGLRCTEEGYHTSLQTRKPRLHNQHNLCQLPHFSLLGKDQSFALPHSGPFPLGCGLHFFCRGCREALTTLARSPFGSREKPNSLLQLWEGANCFCSPLVWKLWWLLLSFLSYLTSTTDLSLVALIVSQEEDKRVHVASEYCSPALLVFLSRTQGKAPITCQGCHHVHQNMQISTRLFVSCRALEYFLLFQRESTGTGLQHASSGLENLPIVPHFQLSSMLLRG